MPVSNAMNNSRISSDNVRNSSFMIQLLFDFDTASLQPFINITAALSFPGYYYSSITSKKN